MRLKIFAIAIALCVFLTACSGGGDENDTSADGQASDASSLTAAEDGNNVISDGNPSATNGESVTENGGHFSSSNKADPSKSSGPNGTKNVNNTGTSGKNSGTGVTVPAKKDDIDLLIWRKLNQYENKAVEKFTKDTGINVNIITALDNDYVTKLIEMINAKAAPDIVAVSSSRFPSIINYLQPISEKTFNLSSNDWNLQSMDSFKVNGRYYTVAKRGSVLCEDLNYVMYYNKNTLAGLTDPFELYKQGKWNRNAAIDIIFSKKVSAKIGFKGIALQSYDLFMQADGTDFVSYDGKKFTNNLKNAAQKSVISTAFADIAFLTLNDCLISWDPNGVRTGTIGLFGGISYGLFKESYWYSNVSSDALGAVPIPGSRYGNNYVPTEARGFGIVKSNDNVEGAAYFLNYLLDPNTIDIDNYFYNEQFKDNFLILSKSQKQVRYSNALFDSYQIGSFSKLCNELADSDYHNIAGPLDKSSGLIDGAVNKGNGLLSQIK